MELYDDEELKRLADQQKIYANQYDTMMKGTLDSQKKAYEEATEAEIRDTEEAYQGSIDLQNVQRLINERRVSEAMANAGLTDSGLNRTQQTAVQLSHSNAVAQLELQKQKQVDALKLALTQKKAELDSTYQASKAQYVQNAQAAEAEAAEKALSATQARAADTNSAFLTMQDKYYKTEDPAQRQALVNSHLEAYPDDEAAAEWAADELGWVEDQNTGYLRPPTAQEYAAFVKNQNKNALDMKATNRITQFTKNTNGTYFDNETHRTYYGIRKNADMIGDDLTQEDTDKLDKAFKTKDWGTFLSVANQIAANGISTFAIDKYMEETYGKMWLIATSVDPYKNYTPSVVETFGGGVKGGDLDDNATVSIAGAEDETIGDLYNYAKVTIGMATSVAKAYLKGYGTGRYK